MSALLELMGVSTGDVNVELLGSKYDHFFRWHSRETTEVMDTGDVEFPMGHAALLDVSAVVVADFAAADEDADLPAPGWYIAVTDSHGLIFVFDFHGTGTLAEEGARKAFARFEEEFVKWSDEEKHVNYPHWPGYLIDCPACESKCHCTKGSAECVWQGHEG